MQFTPQQLAGGGRYNPKVKIGNWNEDRSGFEIRGKDYERKRAQNSLLVSHRAKQRIIGTQKVPHSFSADGKVRFGDTVLLKVVEENAAGHGVETFLVNNIWDVLDSRSGKVAVMGNASARTAMARNTFTIVRAADRDGVRPVLGTDGKDVLHYGQRFYLASNPSLRVDERTGMAYPPFYVASDTASAILGEGRKERQDVYMLPDASFACEWKVGAADGDDLSKAGTPVPAGAPITLVHVKTNQALASALADAASTEFGAEQGVHARTHRPLGRAKEGASLPAAAINTWYMVTAASPADAVDDRGLEPLSPEAILEKVKQMILSRGANSIRGLGRAFRIMDDAGDGKLDQADFKYGLKDYGVHLSDEEFKLVMTAFDRDGDGYVGFTEFLTALRGELNDRRRTMVGMAYDVLDKDGSGLVTLEDIKMAYDATSDPRVAAGEVSEDAVLREFMSQWDTLKADGIVTREEFEEYYGDISASIDDDDYFELMIRNAWHIMGGEGWSANTANRRVLVTHSNGSQEVVAIHNDLGIGADDLDAMRAALEKQGVRDIVAIETSS